jgi:uncharacterized membrane protein YeaQ/YmgE (transglycosylase-associated protein family)
LQGKKQLLASHQAVLRKTDSFNTRRPLHKLRITRRQPLFGLRVQYARGLPGIWGVPVEAIAASSARASAGTSPVTCSSSMGAFYGESLVNCQTPGFILDDVLKASAGGKSMFHLIWYILIGLIAGVIAKSVMHVHMTIFWTIVLGIIGSIIGGAVTHMFSRPSNERFHPAGLIFSTLGAILILFICYKLKIHFPQVNPF